MRAWEGLVAARRIRTDYPSVGVLVLSTYVETDFAEVLLGDSGGVVIGHADRLPEKASGG